jgi:hypothetical protein
MCRACGRTQGLHYEGCTAETPSSPEEPSEPELEDPNSHIGAPAGPPAHPQTCICVKCETRRAVKSAALQRTGEKERSPTESIIDGAGPGPSF